MTLIGEKKSKYPMVVELNSAVAQFPLNQFNLCNACMYLCLVSICTNCTVESLQALKAVFEPAHNECSFLFFCLFCILHLLQEKSLDCSWTSGLDPFVW